MSRIRTLLAGAAVATAAVLFAAAPASAHDELVSADPAADAVLTEAPEQLTLTFSSNLLSIDEASSGTAIVVTDESGTDWVDGAPTVQADTVSVPLKTGVPNGAYSVTWQVVSSDGHPTSGDYSFRVDAPEAAATPSAEPEQSTAAPSADASAEPTPSATPEEGAADYLPGALIGLVGVLALVGVVVWVMLARKRKA
ncbi:copper resistance CopC family protein [Microbacterium istanbulense]|uniref:Copper resistance CopC family protein n=1 Tax=Microbacterium istanbulense TaxID=3122049 RepID=A0ABU8LH49_9MICO